MIKGKSSSFNVSTSNPYISGVVQWSEEYDIGENVSLVTASLYLSRTNTGYITEGWSEFTLSIGGDQKTFTGTLTVTYLSNTLCVTHTARVPHGADGKKSVAIGVSGNVYTNYLSYQESTVALTDIPRASGFSYEGNTLGEAVSVKITAASEDFSHVFSWQAGEGSGEFPLNSGENTLIWTPEYALAAYFPHSREVQGAFTLKTLRQGQVIGEKTEEFSLKIPENEAFLPDFAFSPILKLSEAVPENWDIFVQGKSRAQVSLANLASKFGAEIETAEITFLGQKGENTLTADLLESGEFAFSARVTDSRGFSQTLSSEKFTVYPYEPPVITAVSYFRCNDKHEPQTDGEVLSFTCELAASPVGENRVESAVLTAFLDGEEKGAYAVENGTNFLDGYFNFSATYSLRLEITDTLGEKDFYEGVLNTADCVLNVNKKGNGMAIGKYAEEENALDLKWKLIARGGIEVDGKDLAESIAENLTAQLGGQLKEQLTAHFSELFYPVGSIWVSFNEADDPHVRFGGAWERLEKVFLYAAEIGKVGQTGGEEAHTLSIGEMPVHRHDLVTASGEIVDHFGGSEAGYGIYSGTSNETVFREYPSSLTTTGGSQPHNNMPPYVAVAVWKRIA